MAGKTEMGKLAILLSGDAGPLERELSRAQTMMTGFARKVASPISIGSTIASGIGGLVSGPAGVLGSAASTLSSVFNPMESHLLNSQKFHEAIVDLTERTTTLAREAKKLDFEPQFLASLRMAAGRDADSVSTAAAHLQKIVGESAMGGAAEEKYGVSNKDRLGKYGIDVKELAGMTSEEQLVTVAKRMVALKDHTAAAGLAFDAFGRSGKDAGEGLMKFATDIDKYVNKIKELGLWSPTQVYLSKEMEQMHREHSARLDAVTTRANERYGALGEEGYQEMKESGVLGKKFRVGLDKWMTSKTVGLANALGLDYTVEDFGYKQDAVEKAKAAAEADQGGPTAAEQRVINAKNEAHQASVRLQQELAKETAALTGQTNAMKVAAQAANQYTSAEDKAANAAALASLATEKAAKDAEHQLARLQEETMTPMQKFMAEMERLDKLELLDQDAAPGAIERGRIKAAQALGLGGAGSDYKLAGGALKGSAEDVHTMNQQFADQQKSNRTPAEMAAAQLEEMKNAAKQRDIQNKAAIELIKLIRENGAAIFPED